VDDHPAFVTDTHPLVFHAVAGRRLGRRVAAHFLACDRGEAVTYVPVPVVWEVVILTRIRRIDLACPLREFFATLFSNPAYQPLDLTVEHVLLAAEIRVGRDPFDDLICAAAVSLELPLITADQRIQDSGKVKTAWD